MSAINIIQKNIKLLWEKFKSPLGHSSIGNKFNSMYDLEKFLKQSHISFIENEIERLEIQYVNENPVDCIDGETPVETYGYEELENVVIKRQVDHYKELLKELNK